MIEGKVWRKEREVLSNRADRRAFATLTRIPTLWMARTKGEAEAVLLLDPEADVRRGSSALTSIPMTSTPQM